MFTIRKVTFQEGQLFYINAMLEDMKIRLVKMPISMFYSSNKHIFMQACGKIKNELGAFAIILKNLFS